MLKLSLVIASSLLSAGFAFADPDKDESGKGRRGYYAEDYRDDYRGRDNYGESAVEIAAMEAVGEGAFRQATIHRPVNAACGIRIDTQAISHRLTAADSGSRRDHAIDGLGPVRTARQDER